MVISQKSPLPSLSINTCTTWLDSRRKRPLSSKVTEEDIKVVNEITKAEFPVSLKAYGDGALQLSTDKTSSMFPRLEREGKQISSPSKVKASFDDPAFSAFTTIDVLPLIYDEKAQRCNILVFDSIRRDPRQFELPASRQGREETPGI